MTTNTSQAWQQWKRTALLLLALLVGVAGGARLAAAQNASSPDLQLEVRAEEWMWAYPDMYKQTFLVHNPGSVPEWDPELKRWVGYRLGGPASNVVAQFSLRDGLTFVSAAADSGFTCAHSNGVVTCSNGKIANTHSAVITLTVQVPPGMGWDCDIYYIDIVVDPSDTIAERSESNNSATAETVFGWSCIN